MVGIGRDVRVHRRLVPSCDAPRPTFVVAARVERVPGEVEVVFVEPAREILRRRRDLDQVVRIPRPSKRDRWLSEERVDVHRLVGLARAALLLLLDEPDDRRVALGERLLVGDTRRSCRSDGERGERREQDEREATRGAQRPRPPAGLGHEQIEAEAARERSLTPSG